MPVPQIGTPASWRNSNCSWKTSVVSWSKPTITPACTRIPWRSISRMSPVRSLARFWRFFTPARALLFGVSIPTNAMRSPASAHSSRISGFRATSMESCVPKTTGLGCLDRFHSHRALRIAVAFFRLAVKLSSEMKMPR